MAPYAAELVTKKDDASELYVDTSHMQENKKPLFFGNYTFRAANS